MWLRDREFYQEMATSVEPVTVVGSKDHWASGFLWWVGAVLTLGLLYLGIPRRRYLEDFATAVGPRQGYPRGWSYLKCSTVFHESRHTTQAVTFGWVFFFVTWINRRIRAWLGLLPMAAVYFLLPFPVYLAAGRFYLELDADRVAWRRCLEKGLMTPSEVLASSRVRAEVLSSGSYLWAWPRVWAQRAYHRAAVRVLHLWSKG